MLPSSETIGETEEIVTGDFSPKIKKKKKKVIILTLLAKECKFFKSGNKRQNQLSA